MLSLFFSRENAVTKRKTPLVFVALFLAGVAGIVAGRLMGWGADAQEESAISATHPTSRLGTALGQAIGLVPGKPADPQRRD